MLPIRHDFYKDTENKSYEVMRLYPEFKRKPGEGDRQCVAGSRSLQATPKGQCVKLCRYNFYGYQKTEHLKKAAGGEQGQPKRPHIGCKQQGHSNRTTLTHLELT